MTTEEYCREIEAYLCRKNDGHLVRIVGPSFERVSGWSSGGIPFKIACVGIDRYFVRYYAKGPRRRPVQIDFCEADVLDAFDEWRRAVGVRLPGSTPAADEAPNRQKRSLPEHLNRVLERVSSRLTVPSQLPDPLKQVLERIADEVSALSEQPSLRGESRQQAIARLQELDRRMLDAARESADAALLEQLRREAAVQLEAFRERIPDREFAAATEAALDALLRERDKLPSLVFA